MPKVRYSGSMSFGSSTKHKVHGLISVLNTLAKPHVTWLCLAVDAAHFSNLPALLFDVCLVDADGVYPNPRVHAISPKLLEGMIKILSYAEGLSVDAYLTSILGRAPYIRHCRVPLTAIE